MTPMSFVVRTVSFAASGREIVREQPIAGDTATVGRDPACDIVLPDLGVSRHHATLTIAGNAVRAVAVDNLPFEVDGRSTDDGAVPLKTGGEIVIGAFRLTVAAGTAQDVLITVERMAQLARSAELTDDRALFSLAGVAPGKRKLAWTLALAILVGFLVWPIWSFHARETARLTPRQLASASAADAAWSPGPLSQAHAGLEKNCTACHQEAFVAVRDGGCKSCHQDVHDHADLKRLALAKAAPDWAGRLKLAVAGAFNRPAGRCVGCHTEHQGAVAMAPTPQHFCADCHGDLKARLPDTKLADAGDFATAHPQFRPAVVVESGPTPRFQRVSLDAKPLQNTGLKFTHADHLSATNAVARMAQTLGLAGGQARAGAGLTCGSCHKPDGRGAFQPVDMESNCQSCHSLAFTRSDGTIRTLRHGQPAQVVAELKDFFAVHGPTRPTGLGDGLRRRPGDFAAASLGATYGTALANRGESAAAAIRRVFSPGGACYDCHTVLPAGGLSFRIGPVVQQSRYLLNGWFDHRAHSTQQCSDCHAAKTSNDARQLLLPKVTECRTCHVGEAGGRGKVASTCAMCHVYHRDPGGSGVPDPRRRPLTVTTVNRLRERGDE